ncbi:LOW QUALITY PROTEIN: uncharacterized protein LOC110181181 [Drosophila serrata]|uniref:LOW QUALITY PROTEIN: uncharacterized protein LOC110181181 n=1 Tax=Drosophila serrata TaxID=7274 RepID=UPI000A1D0C0B|nr:LOW QUALITY PROTEIN: uncharacterized protein LOC110181181 [Drosophila serrata]
MLEHRRRFYSRLEPIAAIPSTRTTTTRRTRRLCLNIETNGAGPVRSRRRRKTALPDPYFMTYPPVYEANPWICGDWGSNEHFYSCGNFVNPVNRLYAGEEYGYAPVNEFIPPEEEPPQEWYANNSGQKAACDLKNVLMTLESYLQEENNMEPENNVEPDATEVPEDQNPQNNQLPVLLDLIYDTIGLLNNYMTAKSNNNEYMDTHEMGPPSKPPVQVLQLPVQPLILPPVITNPNMYPLNYPYVMEPAPCPTESKTHFERLPWLKERKRKRSSKSFTHVQSRSCSTDDLGRLPRILKASNSIDSRGSMFFSPQMRDSSTTMWCPMKCCKEYGGLVRIQEQEKAVEDFEISSPNTIRCPVKCGLVRIQELKSLSKILIIQLMTIRSPMECGLVRTLEQEKPAENFEVLSPMTTRSPMKCGLVTTQEQEKPAEDFEVPSPMTIQSPMKCGLVTTQEQEKPAEDFEVLSPRIRYPTKCGLVRTPEQEKPVEDFKTPPPTIRYPTKCHKREKPTEDFKIPSLMTISEHFPPSPLRAPPPSMKSEDDMDRDHEMDSCHPSSKLNYPVVAFPQTSTYSTSCEYHRHTGGNLLYSYVEEEKEEELQLEAEEEHVDDDEWYLGASHKLAELEMEQEFFKEMQKQSQVITRDQQQQTDQKIANCNSFVNFRVTTDKAVSTTDISGLTSREPVKIVRICKRSSLKPRQRLSINNPRGKSKDSHKVKFEREQQTPIEPEIITIGRYPMDFEDTARSINRSSIKRFNSSSISKERRTYRDQSY